jgi:hypothetical protein
VRHPLLAGREFLDVACYLLLSEAVAREIDDRASFLARRRLLTSEVAAEPTAQKRKTTGPCLTGPVVPFMWRIRAKWRWRVRACEARAIATSRHGVEIACFRGTMTPQIRQNDISRFLNGRRRRRRPLPFAGFLSLRSCC